jgi:hypothetical protein
VFVRKGSTWSQQAYLKASNTDTGDSFGSSVGISGGIIVVGAMHAPFINGDREDNKFGAAYVFVRSGSRWTQLAYLKPATRPGVALFGSSAAVSGDTAVVGAPVGTLHSSNFGVRYFGSAWAFGRLAFETSDVTVNSSPPGRLFHAIGSGCESGMNFVTPKALRWTAGFACQLMFPTPQTPGGARYVFSHWDNASADPVRSIAGPGFYDAAFTTEYLLTTVASPPEGGTVTPATGYHSVGTMLVTAEPTCGYRFGDWSGATVSNVPRDVYMSDEAGYGRLSFTGPVSLTAHFVAAPATALSTQVGSILTIRGTPFRYRQTVRAINTTGMTSDVLFFLGGFGPGVTVVSPLGPSGTTRCLTPAGRAYYTVSNVAAGAAAQMTFVFTAPNSQSVVYAVSAVASVAAK